MWIPRMDNWNMDYKFDIGTFEHSPWYALQTSKLKKWKQYEY